MQHNTRIIGLAGTNGSGKDAVATLLATNHNFLFISVSDLLRNELQRRGQSTERENTRQLSIEWRRSYGLSVLVDKAVETYEAALAAGQHYDGLVMSSLRNPSEPQRIHELGGTMVWIDADPHVRYQRVQDNKRIGRGSDDDKTFEQFMADEQLEMQKPAEGDDASLNMSAVRDQADITLVNNGMDLAQLDVYIKEQLHL